MIWEILNDIISEMIRQTLIQGNLIYSSHFMIETVITNLAVTFLTALVIFYIYKLTYNGVLYSKNFNVTLLMISMITCVVVMIVGGNLALSLGMVGALSIVRFRTAVKDPKDTGFMYWTISTGIICGVSAYMLAIASVLFIGLIVILFSKKMVFEDPYLLIMKFENHDADMLKHDTVALKLKHNPNSLKLEDNTDLLNLEDNTASLNMILKKYCKKYITRSSTWDDNEDSERIFEVKLKEENQNKLIIEIKRLKGIKQIRLVSYSGDLKTI